MSITIIILCALCAIAYWYIQPASPKLAFATSNRGRGRHPKYDVRLTVAAADARPRVAQRYIPVGGFMQDRPSFSWDKAVKELTVLRLDLIWTGADYDSTWTKTTEPVWCLSLADMICPDFIKLDVRSIKRLRPEYRQRVEAMVHAARAQGIKCNGKQYFLSGTTQSTKSGVLYAYAYPSEVTRNSDGDEVITGYWQKNGFSRDKDMVRGGALHAPCHYGIFRHVEVELIKVDDEDASPYRVGDGQASAGWAIFTLVTRAREMSNKVTRRQAPQIRAVLEEMGPHNILVKGELVYDPKLDPWQLAVRTDDIKGDGRNHWPSGSKLDMVIGCLEMGRHLSMGYSHQSLHFCDPSVYEAMKAERLNVAQKLNESMQPEKLARAAKGYIDASGRRCFKRSIRTEHGVDRQILLAKIAQFCLDVGNDTIFRSTSLNLMLMETFAEWARRTGQRPHRVSHRAQGQAREYQRHPHPSGRRAAQGV